MPTVKLSPLFNDQQFTTAGVPASGYLLNAYIAGSTTRLDTYTSSAGSVAHTNPIVFDANGYSTGGPIWLQAGLLYKFIYTDASGNQIGPTYDNVSGTNDTASSVSQWVASGVTPTYVSAASFTLPGDQTVEFHVGRRLQFTVTAGTVYGTIKTAAYSSVTTITLTTESQALDSGLSVVNLSILRADHLASPTPQEASSINAGPIGEGRNKIINGDFRIDQKNLGASQTYNAGGALAYCADQWYGFCNGANLTGQRITSNGTYRYRFTGLASVTNVGLAQRMEADSTYDLAGTTATLSALLSSSSLTTITWAAYYANSKDTFGTLASPTHTQIATGTFTITSSETRYTTQISIPSAATTGLEIVFTGGALLGTQTLTFGDVYLVRSTVSEDHFPRRQYGTELALCQRFLPAYNSQSTNENVCTGHSTSATAFRMSFPFVVEPRVPPTGISVSSAAHFSVLESANTAMSTLAFSSASKKAALMSGTVASGLTTGYGSMMTCTSASGQILFTGCQL